MGSVTFEDLRELVTIQPGAVVSKVVYREGGIDVTVFGFDAGEGLTEHAAARAAIVQVLAGDLLFGVEGRQDGCDLIVGDRESGDGPLPEGRRAHDHAPDDAPRGDPHRRRPSQPEPVPRLTAFPLDTYPVHGRWFARVPLAQSQTASGERRAPEGDRPDEDETTVAPEATETEGPLRPPPRR